MREVLLVGAGGCLGAIARHLLGGVLAAAPGAHRFPLGTLVVNVLGCALIGVFAALAERMPGLEGPARLFLVTGLLGGFTTFSAFGLETTLLLRRGDAVLAGSYVAASVALGLAAVWLGMRLATVAR
ncbi:fluoride efflux transporter CrcB [Lysobacter xanthus]